MFRARHEGVRKLAIDNLKLEYAAEQKRLIANHDLDSIGLGLQLMTAEMNIWSAINGTLEADSRSKLSLGMQGPLSPEVKIRFQADANHRLAEAGKLYDASGVSYETALTK
jgi:hypothetical protein